jgi:hypothetical protein
MREGNMADFRDQEKDYSKVRFKDVLSSKHTRGYGHCGQHQEFLMKI